MFFFCLFKTSSSLECLLFVSGFKKNLGNSERHNEFPYLGIFTQDLTVIFYSSVSAVEILQRVKRRQSDCELIPVLAAGERLGR